MSKEGHCPHCHKHCSLASPKCGRGKAYAKALRHQAHLEKTTHTEEGIIMEPERTLPEFPLEEKLLTAMRDSTHILHHSTASKGGRGRILALLKRSGGMSQRQIMDVVGISSAALSEVLGKLEGYGWIERVRSDSDKRNVDVTLTADGDIEAEKAIQEWEASSQALFQGISDAEKAALLEILDKLNVDWKARYQGMDDGEGFRGRGFGRTLLAPEHCCQGKHGHKDEGHCDCGGSEAIEVHHHLHHHYHQDVQAGSAHAEAPTLCGERHKHHHEGDKGCGAKHHQSREHDEEHHHCKHKRKHHHD